MVVDWGNAGTRVGVRIRAAAVGCIAGLVTACGGGGDGGGTTEPPAVTVGSVTVTLGVAQVISGGTTTASAEVRSTTGAVLSGRSISWSSSSPSVATIDGAGAIVAVSAGTTSITATSEGKSGSATLTVTPPPVASVSLSLAQSSVVAGSTTSASVVLRDNGGNTLTGRSIAFTSSNTGVATIDNSGGIVAVSAGTTTITAMSEGKTGSATLTVIPPPVASISVSLAQSSLQVGGSTSASAVLRDANGVVLSDRSIAWSSSNTAVASVSASGVVTALAGGTASIMATSEGKSGMATVTVTLPPVASVTLSGAGRVKVGDTYTYTATLRLADGTVVTRPIVWSVTNPSRATITNNGVLVATQAGAFTIQLLIDGEIWTSNYTAYDWDTFISGGTRFVLIDADNTITNRFGTSNYAELVFSCGTSGSFFVWVNAPHVVTASGTVALLFDEGAAYSEVWNELSPNYNTLWKPGSNSVTKGFAVQIQNARIFGFAFGEFLGSTKAMLFRVSGLGSLLPPLFSACPSSSIVANGAVADGVAAEAVFAEHRALLARRTPTVRSAALETASGQRSRHVGPVAMPSEGLVRVLQAMGPFPVVSSQVAHRRR